MKGCQQWHFFQFTFFILQNIYVQGFLFAIIQIFLNFINRKQKNAKILQIIW